MGLEVCLGVLTRWPPTGQAADHAPAHGTPYGIHIAPTRRHGGAGQRDNADQTGLLPGTWGWTPSTAQGASLGILWIN